MNKLTIWFKALPPWLQSLLYAVETGVVAALTVFLLALYGATQTGTLGTFDWKGQGYLLLVAVIGAIVKAILDLLKGNPPAQQKGL